LEYISTIHAYARKIKRRSKKIDAQQQSHQNLSSLLHQQTKLTKQTKAMFCCDQELQALRHFASLTGIIGEEEEEYADMNAIEPAIHDIMVFGMNESPPLDAIHSYSYFSDLPKCPEAPRKKPRLMIDDQHDQVNGFHPYGDVPYFPFDGFDRTNSQDSTLPPKKLKFDKFDEPNLVSEDNATLPNVTDPEERRHIEPKQEREDGPSRSREEDEPDERTT
jgi:hypothetical protein